MIKRVYSDVLLQRLGQFPVVALVGARQIGKSTLVRSEPVASGRQYHTLDDFLTLGLAKKDPQALLGTEQPLTLDEIQRCPDLLMAIKIDVDRHRQPGRFLLTGSADLSLVADLSRILAGRVSVIHMPPLLSSEISGHLAAPLILDWLGYESASQIAASLSGLSFRDFDGAAVLRGGYPLAVTASSREAARDWFESYRYTYLERDVRQVSEIGHLAEFARLMELCASRSGQILNQSELGRDIGLGTATTGRYLSLLEATFQIRRLFPYFRNIGKRLVKAPKLYWTDTGLLAHLMGWASWQDCVAGHHAGAMVETWFMTELSGLLSAWLPEARLYYWRTHTGIEVDGVLQHGARLLPFEIKATMTLRTDDARNLRLFMQDEPMARAGVVFYLGREVRMLAENVLAVPVTVLSGCDRMRGRQAED